MASENYRVPVNEAMIPGATIAVPYNAFRGPASYDEAGVHTMTVGQGVYRTPTHFTIDFDTNQFVITVVSTIATPALPFWAAVQVKQIGTSADRIDSLDDIPDGGGRVALTPGQREKLVGIEEGAQRNPTTLDQLPDGLVRKAVSPDDIAKLDTVPSDAVSKALLGTVGYPPAIGVDGKLPASLLPASGEVFKGTWNAASNSPTLVSGGGAYQAGDYFIVSVAGSTALDGLSTWNPGDRVVLDPSPKVWKRVPASGVVSVQGLTGVVTLSAASVSAAPSTHVAAGGAEHAAATTSVAGFMSAADKTKLDGVATNAAAALAAATNEEVTLGAGVSPRAFSPSQIALAAATHAPAVTANAVGNDILADMPTSRVKGRVAAGSGDPEDLTAAQVRTLLNVADGANANPAQVSGAERTAGTETALRSFAPADVASMAATHGGGAVSDGAISTAKLADAAVTTVKIADVNVTTAKLADGAATSPKIADSNITTAKLADGAVTNAKAANVATATIKGRVTAGTGVVEDLTATQVRTLINVTSGAEPNPAQVSGAERTAGTGTALRSFAPADVKAMAEAHALPAGTRLANNQLAQIATLRLKGRVSAGTGDVEDLDAAAAQTLLGVSAVPAVALAYSHATATATGVLTNAVKHGYATSNRQRCNLTNAAEVIFAGSFDTVTQDVWFCLTVTTDGGSTFYYLNGDLVGSSAPASTSAVGAVFMNPSGVAGTLTEFYVTIPVHSTIRGFGSNARVNLTTFPAGPDGGAVRTTPVDYTPTGATQFGAQRSFRLLVPKGVGSGGGAATINDLNDVDTVTITPVTGMSIVWDGTNWVPGNARATDGQVTTGTATTFHTYSPAQLKLAAQTHGAGLADGAVVSAKLADGAVVTAKIGDIQITSIKIADGAVTRGKLADTVVDASKIEDGAVATAKIADAAVTGAKIAADTITAANIANEGVGTDELANLAVGASKLKDDAVTTAKIANGAVTAAKQASVATATIQGRTTAGTGSIETLTGDQALGVLGLPVGLKTQVTSGEKSAGTETAARHFSPLDVKEMAELFGGGSSPGNVTLITAAEVGDSATTSTTSRGISGARLIEFLEFWSFARQNSGAGTIFAYSKKWNGTGFRPGNTGAQNSDALAAIFAEARQRPTAIIFPGGVYEIAKSFSPSGYAQSSVSDENTRGDDLTLVAMGTVELKASADITAYMKQRFWADPDTVVDSTATPNKQTSKLVPWDPAVDNHFIQTGGNLKDLRILVNIRNCQGIRFNGCWVFNGNNKATTSVKMILLGSSGGTVQTGNGRSGAHSGHIEDVQMINGTIGIMAGAFGYNDPGPGANQRSADTFTQFSIGNLRVEGCDASFVGHSNHFDNLKINKFNSKTPNRSYLMGTHNIYIGTGFINMTAGSGILGPRHSIVVMNSNITFESVYFNTGTEESEGTILFCEKSAGRIFYHADTSKSAQTGCWVRVGRSPSGVKAEQVSLIAEHAPFSASASKIAGVEGICQTQTVAAGGNATINGEFATSGYVRVPGHPAGGANHPGFDGLIKWGSFTGTRVLRCHYANWAGTGGTGSVDVTLDGEAAAGSRVARIGRRAERWTRFENTSASTIPGFSIDVQRGWNMTGAAAESGKVGGIAVEAHDTARCIITFRCAADGTDYDPIKVWGAGGTIRCRIESARNESAFNSATNFGKTFIINSSGNLA